MSILLSTLSLGLLWAVLSLGVFISFRVLSISDLSVEGTFPLGAAVSALLITRGFDPLLSLLAATLAGALAGLFTGFLHTRLGIPSLLAGILTMTGLYSVNLRVMGKSNISLLGQKTVYTVLQSPGFGRDVAIVLIALATVGLLLLLIYLFFGTELGMAIRATGFNPQMIRALGVNTDRMILFGLMLANALVGLAGGLLAQNNGFADVGMGVGTIVTGLAAVIIGEVIFGQRSFKTTLLSICLGSVLYRTAIALVLAIGLSPNDLKLLTALLVAFALYLPKLKTEMASHRNAKRKDKEVKHASN